MLRGTLDDFTLPDIFRLMSLGKRTGKVDVIRSAGQGKVFFRDGEVYYAESTVSRDPLGQKLIRSGSLTEGDLMKALDESASSGARVGEILVRNGSVSEDELKGAVRQQIEDSVFDLLRWGAGEFSWDADVIADVEVPISVSVENLIIEASRRLDELEVITRKIPSETTVLKMAPAPPAGAVEINITPEEWRMLVLINGTSSVHDIAVITGTDDLTTMRRLYGLVSAGLVEVAESGEEDDESSAEHEHVVGFGDAAAIQEQVEDQDISLDFDELEFNHSGYESPAEDPSGSDPSEVDALEMDALEFDALDFDSLEPIDRDDTSRHSPSSEVALEDHALSSFAADIPIELDLSDPSDVGEGSIDEFEPLAPDATGSTDLGSISPSDPEVVAEDAASREAAEAVIESEAAARADSEVDEISLREAEEEEPLSVESFDAPEPDELVTQTPDADDFLAELLDGGDTASRQASPAAPRSAPPPAPDRAAPVAPERSGPPPASIDPARESDVDRASMARELAGLFSDDVPRPAPVRKPNLDAAPGEPDGRKRVEDDDQVNKGLISRLIDGVKGL